VVSRLFMVAPPIHDGPDIQEPSERPLSASRNAHLCRPVFTRINLITDDAGRLPPGQVISVSRERHEHGFEALGQRPQVVGPKYPHVAPTRWTPPTDKPPFRGPASRHTCAGRRTDGDRTANADVPLLFALARTI